MRLLISLYERQLSLKAKFSEERKSGNKVIKAGEFADLEFPFKNGFPFPDPKDCMGNISAQSISKFQRRFDTQDPDFADNVSRSVFCCLIF